MNATKFVVVILIGVVCANVIAISQREGVSKETKLGISDPRTATTNGVGAELSVVVNTQDYGSHSTSAYASHSPDGPTGNTYQGSYFGTGGTVNASGPNANASTTSGGAGTSTSIAEASSRTAQANGTTNSGASTSTTGSTVPTPPSVSEPER